MSLTPHHAINTWRKYFINSKYQLAYKKYNYLVYEITLAAITNEETATKLSKRNKYFYTLSQENCYLLRLN
jgi:hypothetical protein